MERAEHCGAAELHGTRISPVLLSNLGAHAQLGRSFAPGDDLPQRNRLIIISDRAWRTLYEEDRGVLGLSLMIDGQPYTLDDHAHCQPAVLPGDKHENHPGPHVFRRGSRSPS